MDVALIREGIRKMRFSCVFDRWEAGETGAFRSARGGVRFECPPLRGSRRPKLNLRLKSRLQALALR